MRPGFESQSRKVHDNDIWTGRLAFRVHAIVDAWKCLKAMRQGCSTIIIISDLQYHLYIFWRYAYTGNRTRVTSMGNLYGAAILRALARTKCKIACQTSKNFPDRYRVRLLHPLPAHVFKERSAQPVILVARSLDLPKAFASDEHAQQFSRCLAYPLTSLDALLSGER